MYKNEKIYTLPKEPTRTAEIGKNCNTYFYVLSCFCILILAATQIFEGELCFTNVAKDANGKLVTDDLACTENNYKLKPGMPNVQLDASGNYSLPSNANVGAKYVTDATLTGGWPVTNSGMHIALSLFSVAFLAVIRTVNTPKFRFMAWGSIGVAWLITIVSDCTTLNGWKVYCSKGDRDSINALFQDSRSDLVKQTLDHMGSTDLLSNATCEIGAHLVLIIFLSFACISSLSNACIARLSYKSNESASAVSINLEYSSDFIDNSNAAYKSI